MGKLIDKMNLLARLYLFKDSVKIENWNEYTRSWSKGRLHGFNEAIKVVEDYDDTKLEGD